MPSTNHLAPADFEKLRRLDTCTVSNAIERFNVRPRNEGFMYRSIRCRFPHLPPMAGYAVPARIRSTTPPATAPPITRGCYYDRMDFWRYVTTVPAPRVIVLQDADRSPGFGAFVGEIHAQIAKALHCAGCVTNGAVRDLPAVEAAGFQMFSANLSVSHAYAHIVEFGEPVEIGGLKIHAGDLLHGDRHGVLQVPLSIAAEIPQMAAALVAQERELIAFCESPGLTLDGLAAQLRRITESHRDVHSDGSPDCA